MDKLKCTKLIAASNASHKVNKNVCAHVQRHTCCSFVRFACDEYLLIVAEALINYLGCICKMPANPPFARVGKEKGPTNNAEINLDVFIIIITSLCPLPSSSNEIESVLFIVYVFVYALAKWNGHRKCLIHFKTNVLCIYRQQYGCCFF